MSDAIDAWEAWQHVKRALHTVLPWTPEWLRLRLVEQELRSEWERLVLDEMADRVRLDDEHDDRTYTEPVRGGPKSETPGLKTRLANDGSPD
jgi:hypothetical protein